MHSVSSPRPPSKPNLTRPSNKPAPSCRSWRRGGPAPALRPMAPPLRRPCAAPPRHHPSRLGSRARRARLPPGPASLRRSSCRRRRPEVATKEQWRTGNRAHTGQPGPACLRAGPSILSLGEAPHPDQRWAAGSVSCWLPACLPLAPLQTSSPPATVAETKQLQRQATRVGGRAYLIPCTSPWCTSCGQHVAATAEALPLRGAAKPRYCLAPLPMLRILLMRYVRVISPRRCCQPLHPPPLPLPLSVLLALPVRQIVVFRDGPSGGPSVCAHPIFFGGCPFPRLTPRRESPACPIAPLWCDRGREAGLAGTARCSGLCARTVGVGVGVGVGARRRSGECLATGVGARGPRTRGPGVESRARARRPTGLNGTVHDRRRRRVVALLQPNQTSPSPQSTPSFLATN
jgi:hypothetical protein